MTSCLRKTRRHYHEGKERPAAAGGAECVVMEANKKSYLNLIAGGLFSLMALRQLFYLINYFSFRGLLWVAGYAVAAVMLFIGGRNILPAAGFSLLTLMSLYSFVMYGDKFLNFLELLAYAAIIIVLIAALTDYLPNLTQTARQIWFAPGVLMAVSSVIWLILSLFRGYYPPMSWLFQVFWQVPPIAALFLTGLWATSAAGLTSSQAGRPQNVYGQPTYNQGGQNIYGQPAYGQGGQTTYGQSAYSQGGQTTYGQPAYSQENTYDQPSYSQPGQSSDGYIGMAQHVLLLLLTCGIWNLIWVYRTTDYLNRVEDEPPRIPVNKLLLCMFVPFYSIYWTYQSAQRVDKLAARNGVASDLTTLCLILAIFVPVIPPILMQDKINAIASGGGASYTGTGYTAPQQPRRAPRAGGIGTAEELKAYKELLDSGAITQEEYEAKKRQLLGL